MDVTIGNTRVGDGADPWVIAELSANHQSSKALALEIIAAAAESGADAVKFQHYKPETITVRSAHPDFQIKGGTLWDGKQLADLYQEAMMPWEWTEDLVAECDRRGLTWFSSPFDESAVDFLEQFNPVVYKIASFEMIDLPFVRRVARTNRPIIMSTGMASLSEIDAAVTAVRSESDAGLILLRCNSSYPANPDEMDLAAIPEMKRLWGLPVGLSDHTPSATSAIVAVALGASVIEKHITLDRADGGPDSQFSLEPDEFLHLVKSVKEAKRTIGEVRFGPSAREEASLAFRRSLRIVRPVKAGDVLSMDNVRSVRPAGGMLPDEFAAIVGRRASRDLQVGDPLLRDDVLPSVAPGPSGA